MAQRGRHGSLLRERGDPAGTTGRGCRTRTGVGTWAENGRTTSFLLEYDTALSTCRVLADKLEGYQVVAAGLAWHGQVCPVLLFSFGSPRREQAARRALAATREAAGLRIATTAIDPRVTSPGPGRSGCLARAT